MYLGGRDWTRAALAGVTDTLVPLPGRHARALFVLLILSRAPRSREAIATDLWPESDATSERLGAGTAARPVRTKLAAMTIRIALLPVLAIAVTAALAACSTTATPAGPSAAAGASSSASSAKASNAFGVPAELLAAVRADVAQRTSVDPAAIDLVSAKPVTWNDGSLGCPEPGMTYTPALVTGWQIVVHAADRDLDYRVVTPDVVKLCERPGAVGSGDPGSY